MRLVNVDTLKLEYFEKKAPCYAILSHTWMDGQEVTLQMMQGGDVGYQQRTGWAKIKNCCKRAQKDGWKYVWVDTCCIDKTNGVELGQAINSMFAWYERASICYAYLSDYHEATNDGPHDIRFSRWFTRGWTLQEPIAPRFVDFFNSDWLKIGTRDSLASTITAATNIKAKYLRGRGIFRNASVSEILYWASSRTTERIEDEAYCLLGLFGIYMPPIHGEGANAFRRLQMAIIENRDDETIFAWLFASETYELAGGPEAFFATRPLDFDDCGGFTPSKHDHSRSGFRISNQGLLLHGSIYEEQSPVYAEDRLYILPLNITRTLAGDPDADPDPGTRYLISMYSAPRKGGIDTYQAHHPFASTVESCPAARRADTSPADALFILPGLSYLPPEEAQGFTVREAANIYCSCRVLQLDESIPNDTLRAKLSFASLDLVVPTYISLAVASTDAPWPDKLDIHPPSGKNKSHVYLKPMADAKTHCVAFIAHVCVSGRGSFTIVIGLHWDGRSEIPTCAMWPTTAENLLISDQSRLADEGVKRMASCGTHFAYRDLHFRLETFISPCDVAGYEHEPMLQLQLVAEKKL